MNCFVFVISIKYFLMICVPGIFLFLSNILETLTPTVIVYNRMITWFGPVVATGDRVLEASTVPQSQYSPSTLLSYSSFKVRKKEEEDEKGGINTVQAVPQVLQAGSARTAPREKWRTARSDYHQRFPSLKREILMGSDMNYTCTVTPRMTFLDGDGWYPYLFFLVANFLACFGSWYLQGLEKDLGDFRVLFVFMETLRFTLWKKVMVKGKRHTTHQSIHVRG